MLTVLLFGSPEVWLEGQPVRINRRKSRAVLYYVAAQPHPTPRETLLGLLWPEAPRAVAQQTLRTTLYGLRQALGPALAVETELVGLAGDSLVDALRFEAALAYPGDTAALNEALNLYRGEFLAGFNVPNAEPFEAWLTIERERYRRLSMNGFSALSAVHEIGGDYAAALAALDRALSLDPLQEDLQRESIRLAYQAGDRPGAIRRYDQLRRLLDDELGVPPMPETRRLYDAILNEQPLPAPPLTSSLALSLSARPASSPDRTARSARADSVEQLPFTGREAEIRALQDLVDAHKLVLIEGEPGIGKTRLAREFIQTSAALELAGTGRELESHLPYQPFIEALRGLVRRPDWPARQARLRTNLPAVWLSEASRLLPELAGPHGEGQPGSRAAEEARLWEGVSQFLQALAAEGRVILFLDDLHWADASTLALLGYLVRGIRAASLFFIATAQPAPSRSPLASLLVALTREDRLARLPLRRLSAEDIETIARSLSPAHPDPLAAWLLSGSEGNPYILDELVREARQQQILLPDGSLRPEAAAALPLVPQTIYSLVQSRLERLSQNGRRLLDAAVAAGREFDYHLVALASGLADLEALDALDELEAARLVHPLDGERFVFEHSLIMEVAYREVGELRHRLLHRQIAEALESLYTGRTGAVAGQIAWHLAEGGDLERAWPYAFEAGQAAARLAGWAEATAFYEQALQGAPAGQRPSIWLALGEALSRSGQFARASEVLREALLSVQRSGTQEQLDEIRLALGLSLLTQARFVEAIDLAQQALAGGRRETAPAAELLWGTALSLEGSDLSGAAEHLRAAESFYRAEEMKTGEMPLEEAARLSHIAFELGSVLAQQGDLEGAVALYRQALEAAAQGDSDLTLERRILAYNNLAYHLHLLGDPGASEYGLAGLRLAQEKGILGLLPYLYSTLGEIKLTRGELDAAERYFQQGLELAGRLAMPERIAGLTANLGLAALRRGQEALAIHRLSAALGQADALGTRHLAAQIRLWLAPLLPPAERQARLAEARQLAERSGRQRLLEEARRLEKGG
jgi:DNA-binding SARP family transcriptional activator/Tfp pilus assembly protein PilF